MAQWGDRWQEDIRAAAREKLPPPVYRYFAQGAHEGVSAAEAQHSWSSLRFLPHVLRDVSDIDLTTTLLGEQFATPIAIAPTSMQHYAHPDGEVAMGVAAAATDTLLVVPTNSGSTFEAIAATGVRWWLQTYVTRDRTLVEGVVRRAARAGARAIVLTVDTPQVSTRFGADDAAWHEVPDQPSRANFGPEAAAPDLPGAAHADDLTPADIAWLRQLSGLPVVVKGVLRPDDAQVAVRHGAAAIWVSNHGGRQLDRTVSTAAALGPVVTAVGSTAEVYVDGGLCSGLDLLSALASGARAAFLGRLPIFSLAAGGSEAVEFSLSTLRSELLEALRLAGCSNPGDAPGLLATLETQVDDTRVNDQNAL